MKIMLAGGGTMGSVSPLIAVYEEIKKNKPKTEFLFVGTKTGPERLVVESYKINFVAVSSGKLRRYFSWENFIDPFKIFWGFWQSFFIVLRYRPDCIMIAGSFVGVPIAWSAWLLRVPILVHQQDIIAGLANKLMANTAQKITVSFEPSLKDFYPTKTVLTGNAVRQEFYCCDRQKSQQFFKLKQNLPTVLILGGGTGAKKINEIVGRSLPELLSFCQVIHLTGKGKAIDYQAENYQQFEFLTAEILEALCAADLVVSRAGISSLSELTIMAKPTILIPMPQSHQENNAMYFQKNNAVVTLAEESLNEEIFCSAIKEIITDEAKLEDLSRNIRKMMNFNGASNIAKLILELAK